MVFKQLPQGTYVRIGGRLSLGADGSPQLTTTDGGVLSVAGLSSLPDFKTFGFVEVVGIKSNDSSVETAGVTNLGENVDVELWDEAVKMTHSPQVLAFFEPVPAPAL